jgi:putative DNA primase/helicase
MEQTLNELLRTITEDYLESVDKNNPPYPSTIEREILEETNAAIGKYNKGPEDPPGSGEFPYPR